MERKLQRPQKLRAEKEATRHIRELRTKCRNGIFQEAGATAPSLGGGRGSVTKARVPWAPFVAQLSLWKVVW